MSNHSSRKKEHRKKKNLIDRFFDRIFGRKNSKKKHLPASLLEREDFEIELNPGSEEHESSTPAQIPVNPETENIHQNQSNKDPYREPNEAGANTTVAADNNDANQFDHERRKQRRQEYLKEWGLEEDKGFFAKMADKRKIKKSHDVIRQKILSSNKKHRKKTNLIDSFFGRLFKKESHSDREIQQKNFRESQKRKKELRKKKQHFLRRLRKRKKETEKKGNWFTSIFHTKPKDPFLREPEPSASIFRELFKTRKYNYFFINSLFLFLTAYIVVYLIYQFTVLLSASMWNLDSVLYYWDLAFDDYSPKWNKWNIIAITFSGPFICLVIGILFLKVLFNFESLHVSHRLFILWIALHGINRFLGGFVAGVVTDEGFGYVVNWMYIPEFYKILFMILALFLLGVIGYFTTRQFLDVSGSYHFIRKSDRKAYLFSQAVLPSILGSIMLVLIKIPFNPPYETIMIGSFVFLTIPVLFNFRAKPTPVYTNEKLKQKFYLKYFLLFLLLMTFYRVVLDPGLHFEINIDINISNARYFKF